LSWLGAGGTAEMQQFVIEMQAQRKTNRKIVKQLPTTMVQEEKIRTKDEGWAEVKAEAPGHEARREYRKRDSHDQQLLRLGRVCLWASWPCCSCFWPPIIDTVSRRSVTVHARPLGCQVAFSVARWPLQKR